MPRGQINAAKSDTARLIIYLKTNTRKAIRIGPEAKGSAVWCGVAVSPYSTTPLHHPGYTSASPYTTATSSVCSGVSQCVIGLGIRAITGVIGASALKVLNQA